MEDLDLVFLDFRALPSGGVVALGDLLDLAAVVFLDFRALVSLDAVVSLGVRALKVGAGSSLLDLADLADLGAWDAPASTR